MNSSEAHRLRPDPARLDLQAGHDPSPSASPATQGLYLTAGEAERYGIHLRRLLERCDRNIEPEGHEVLPRAVSRTILIKLYNAMAATSVPKLAPWVDRHAASEQRSSREAAE